MTRAVSPTRNTRLGVQARETHASGRARTVCATACAAWFGVDISRVRYCDRLTDLVRHVRGAGWSVRSCASATGAKGVSVGGARAALAKHAADTGAKSYIVCVPNHALVLDAAGRTVIDTAPRQRDARKITHIYAVY